MRIEKQHADKFAREFRSTLNKAARDGLTHEVWFATTKYTVGFKLLVNKPTGEIGSDRTLCHGDGE